MLVQAPIRNWCWLQHLEITLSPLRLFLTSTGLMSGLASLVWANCTINLAPWYLLYTTSTPDTSFTTPRHSLETHLSLFILCKDYLYPFIILLSKRLSNEPKEGVYCHLMVCSSSVKWFRIRYLAEGTLDHWETELFWMLTVRHVNGYLMDCLLTTEHYLSHFPGNIRLMNTFRK